MILSITALYTDDTVMLSVVTLSVVNKLIMPNVIILSVFMMNVIMPSVIILNVVMLDVVAPPQVELQQHRRQLQQKRSPGIQYSIIHSSCYHSSQCNNHLPFCGLRSTTLFMKSTPVANVIKLFYGRKLRLFIKS